MGGGLSQEAAAILGKAPLVTVKSFISTVKGDHCRVLSGDVNC